MGASDDIHLSLPYFSADPPGPLPTQEQIENAHEILAEVGGRKVVRVGEQYAVKYGDAAEEVEAATIIFLRQTTSINLPKVYAVYRSGVKDMLVVIMEYIPGSNLHEAWPMLSAAQKEKVCLELRRQITQLRSLPPLGYFGGVGKQKIQMASSGLVMGREKILA